MKYDIAIIGGGILGTCISYWLSSLFKAKICVIDKESDVAVHASSRNTGIVHSPFYINPKKRVMTNATLQSHSMWESLAKKYDITWNNTGILELALDEKQHKILEKYIKWSRRNNVPKNSIKLLDKKQVAKIEPNVKCYSAIHSNLETSTDFGALTRKIRDISKKNGTKFILQQHVTSINKHIISTNDTEIQANYIINCAGGNSLNIAQMLNLAPKYTNLYFRGEYWITKSYQNLTKSSIYTVPEFEEYPFLDPHWIKRPKLIEVGPNAVPVPGPEIYSGYGDVISGITKLREILSSKTLKLFSNLDFISLISKELLSSLSKDFMINRIQKFLPKVKPESFKTRGTAGIRSQIITPEGKFLSDILEINDNHSFHIINYNSPGATGAPAYSALIINKLKSQGYLDYPRVKKETIWSLKDLTI